MATLKTMAMSKNKQLTPEEVLCRITGCGKSEAAVRVPNLDGKQLVAAYEKSDAAGIQLVLMNEKVEKPKPVETTPEKVSGDDTSGCGT